VKGLLLKTDWKVGSPIRFTTEWEGAVFEQWGKVLVVDEPNRLEYSLFAPRPDLADSPENYFTMIYTLTESSGETLLQILQIDPRLTSEVAGVTGAQRAAAETDSEPNPILVGLKQLCESLQK
jgi:hypothetical protein